MHLRKFRVQKDSLRAINISMALFLRLVTNTCAVVQSTSVSSSNKRSANLLDVDHLCKAVNRYDVLSFMEDLVGEMDEKKEPPPEDDRKRKDREEPMEEVMSEKRPKEDDESQPSITSFFTKN